MFDSDSTLNDIFEETMRREHHTATTYTTGEEFDCFFRRNNDNLNEHDTMVMYYRIDAPVRAGTLINFGGCTYIIINKETIENNIYFKSALVRTNGEVTTHSVSVVGLPIYSRTVNNATADSGTNISIIDGNAEALTEDNAASRALAIDDLLNEWGRTWRVTNLFFIDGIVHIILEVSANVVPTYEYKIVLSPLTSVHVKPGDVDLIKATTYINDHKVSSSTIKYSSSNEEVATIDSSGSISYLADGKVSFTATWTEQGVSATTDVVTIQSEQESSEVSVHIDELTEIYNGFESNFNCYALKGGIRDDTITVTVRAENLSGVSNQTAFLRYIKITDLGSGKYKILVDNGNLLDKTFDLVALIEENGVEVRQVVKIKSFW